MPATLRRRDTGYEVVAAGRDGDAAVLESSGPAAGGASGELETPRTREAATRASRTTTTREDTRNAPSPGPIFNPIYIIRWLSFAGDVV